jgi:hypothetical protein
MPAFNAAPWIEEALSALRKETLNNIEIIVIDDGSTDGTAEIIARVAQEDWRVVALFRQRRGQVAARNIGLAAASADLIAHMDADDRTAPDRLETLRAQLESDPALDAVGCWLRTFGDDREPSRVLKFPSLRDRDCTPFGELFPVPNGPMMYRKSRAHDIGGFRETFVNGSDVDFLARLQDSGGRLDNVQRVLYEYRQRPGQTTANFAEKFIANSLIQLSRRCRAAGVPDLIDTHTRDEIQALDNEQQKGDVRTALEVAQWFLTHSHDLWRRPWSGPTSPPQDPPAVLAQSPHYAQVLMRLAVVNARERYWKAAARFATRLILSEPDYLVRRVTARLGLLKS